MTAAFTRRDVLRGAAGVAGVALTGMALAACSGGESGGDTAASSPGPKGEKPSGRLRLLFQGTAADTVTQEIMFKRFKKLYPDVELEAIADPSTTWASFFSNAQVKIAGGQKFDLIYIPTEGQRLFASKGLLQPIDAWIDRDKTEITDFEDDADPRIVEWCKTLSSPDGKQYFLPFVFNPMCLYFRPSMFADAGIALPTRHWSWDQLYEAAGALTKPGSVYGLTIGSDYFSGIEPWLLTNGTNVLNDDWTKSTFDSPAVAESVAFAKKFVDAKYTPTPGGTFDTLAGAGAGKVAMFGSGRWAVNALRKAKATDQFSIVPFPQKTGYGSPIGWGSIGLMKASENKDAAWAYIKFLLRQETQDFIAETGYAGAVPSRRSSATGPKMTTDSPKGTEELYKAIAYGTPVPGPDQGQLIQETVTKAWVQMLTGSAGIETTLKTANAAIAKALA